eukprot:COSAG05_NODE_3875_length_1795_cov_1.219340_2_plen_183_part_00
MAGVVGTAQGGRLAEVDTGRLAGGRSAVVEAERSAGKRLSGAQDGAGSWPTAEVAGVRDRRSWRHAGGRILPARGTRKRQWRRRPRHCGGSRQKRCRSKLVADRVASAAVKEAETAKVAAVATATTAAKASPQEVGPSGPAPGERLVAATAAVATATVGAGGIGVSESDGLAMEFLFLALAS